MPKSATSEGSGALPVLRVGQPWYRLLEPDSRPSADLASALLPYIATRRWFRNKADGAASARVSAAVSLADGERAAWLAVVDVRLRDDRMQPYVLFLTPEPVAAENTVAELRLAGAEGEPTLFLNEVGETPDVAMRLLSALDGPRVSEGLRLHGASLLGAKDLQQLDATPMTREQSNTSFELGQRVMVKVQRHVEPGPSLELEMLQQLVDAGGCPSPAPLGELKLSWSSGRVASLATLQQFVSNQGDAWQLALGEVGRSCRREAGARKLSPRWLSQLELLGRRTGELHLALASATEGPFAPVLLGSLGEQPGEASLSDLARRRFDLLKNAELAVPPQLAEEVFAQEESLSAGLRDWASAMKPTACIRVHGDLHLGQVLVAGGDFVIIDFEGEPARPAAARRSKRSPLVDVAGMIRSLHYAALYGALGGAEGAVAGHRERRLPLAEAWCRWSSDQYLRGYLAAVAGAGLLPEDEDELERQLRVCSIEKALYEIGYELNHRPEWVSIPMRGLLAALRQPFRQQASSG